LSKHVTGKDDFGIGEQEPIVPIFEVSPLLREIHHGLPRLMSEMHPTDPQHALPNIRVVPLEIVQVGFLPAAAIAPAAVFDGSRALPRASAQ
jgi:hypothetical protein